MAHSFISSSKAISISRQNSVVCFFRNIFFFTFCISLGSTFLIFTKPVQHSVNELEAKLSDVKKQKQRIESEQEYRQIELQALREDPSFLDLHARDRLDVCNDGERILKFRRDR